MFDKLRKIQDEKLSKEFLPEALEIVEKPASPMGHLMIWVTFIIIVLLLTWSIIGTVDETANARGKVITVDGIITIQAASEGVITQIYVKEGDRVKKGDKIMELDSSSIKSSLDYYNEKVELVQLKIQLLNQIAEGKDIDPYLKKAKNKEERDVINFAVSLQKEKEFSLKKYEEEVTVQEKNIAIEQKNLEALEEKNTALNEQKSKLRKQKNDVGTEEEKLNVIKEKIKNLKKEEQDYKELYENEAITKSEWESKKRELGLEVSEKKVQEKSVENVQLEKDEKFDEVVNQISQNKTLIDQQKIKIDLEKENLNIAKETLNNAVQSSNKSILDLIVQADSEQKENEVAFNEKQEEYSKQLITAPDSGIVQAIKLNTVGGVVSHAQELVQIIPDKSQLIMQVNLLNKDVGFVKLGQNASIKLDTFNFQQYGRLKGKIIYISPDAVEDEKAGLVYKVNIAVDTKSFIKGYSKLKITTGMSGTAEIKIGSRRIIEFFLDPLIKNFDESLKVR